MMVNEEDANTPSLRSGAPQHHTLATVSHAPTVRYRGLVEGTKTQSGWLLSIGFGGLISLLAFSGFYGLSTASQISVRNEAIRNQYFLGDRLLQQIRSNMYLSGTLVRDLLLEVDSKQSERYRAQFSEAIATHAALIAEYRQLRDKPRNAAVNKVAEVSREYFDQLQPVLTWTLEQRRSSNVSFSKDVLLPQRSRAISAIDQLSLANARQLEAGSRQIADLSRRFLYNFRILTIGSLLIGLALAAFTIRRILRLEQLTQEQLNQVQDLSSSLVQVQEEERRAIARELHDAVGQSVSGLLLGIGNVAATLSPQQQEGTVVAQLGDLRHLAERTVASVRNLSLSLRPSMLDDLGLLPALQWLARETGRTSNIAIEVVAADLTDKNLQDDVKTCIYRVVQEALVNVARHARATSVQVRLSRADDVLLLAIEDNGRGFQPMEKGLGILGMEERVRHQNGTLQIQSQPGLGTTLTVRIPA